MSASSTATDTAGEITGQSASELIRKFAGALAGQSGTSPVAQLSNYLMAGGTLAELLETPPAAMEALYSHGHQLYGRGRYEEAMKTFIFLLMRDQFDRRYYLGLAACLQMTQRPAEALRYHGMASLLDLSDPLPVFYSAQCLLALGRTGEALPALELAEKLAAGQPRHEALVSRIGAVRQLLSQAPETHSQTGAGNA